MTPKDYLQTALMIMQVLSIVSSALVALMTWWVSRSRARREELDEVNRAMAAVERRVSALEVEIQHLPDHSGDMDRISANIAEFSRSLGELNGVVSGLRRAVDLMNQHLLSNNRSG